MEKLLTQLQILTDRVNQLELQVSGKNNGADFEELIRNVVVFDSDSVSARTTSAVGPVSGGNATITVPKTPDIYLRMYHRGKPYNFGAFNLT